MEEGSKSKKRGVGRRSKRNEREESDKVALS
jgi:hypothetical protein